MSLLVVGSLALDSVETPTEVREDVLGGSAVFFSYAASYFGPVRLVGVVGDDWPARYTDMLKQRKIDTSGLDVVTGGKTFRWRGKYKANMNDRDTLEVHLNVFGNFSPALPAAYKDSDYVFLANGVPETQMAVLGQVNKPKLVVADTMDIWIKEKHDELLSLLKRIDGLVLNDSEAKLLTREENVIVAAKKVLELGPRFVVIKKGEHGALMCTKDEVFVLPAFPTTRVTDPTGAGDSFAGGMMGYIAQQNREDANTLKQALVYGTVVASYNVEDFSLEQMKRIEKSDLDARLAHYRKMMTF